MARRAIREIIETWKDCGCSNSEAARRLGIDRRTVRSWVRRGRRPWGYVGWKGVERASTAPKHPHRVLTGKEEQDVLSLRKGSGFCSEKLAALARGKGTKVSASTVQRLCRKEGLLRLSHKRRRPLFQNGRAMRPDNTPALGYLQIDVKHVTPELSGLPSTCFEYAAIDILSRYKVALVLPVLDEAASVVLLRWAVQSCPFPIRYIQTDNGLEFQSRFHRACQEMGIEHFYIHKNSPRENAVIERSFRTDEDEFFLLLERGAGNINELNVWLQKHLVTYNTVRPHMGIRMLTPKKFVNLYNKS